MAYDYSFPWVEMEETKKETPKNRQTMRNVILGTDITKTVPPVVENGIVHFPGKNRTWFCMDEELLSKHLMLLGGIGSGKTNAFHFIIRSLLHKMTRDDVMIIFDTKGDFESEFYDACAMRKRILIGNGRQYNDRTFIWNIFREIMPDGRYEKVTCDLNAKEIARAMFKDRESETQPFFHLAAADIFSKVLIHFMRDRDSSEWNNESLVNWMQRADAKKYKEMFQLHDDFACCASYIGEGKSAQALGVLGYLNGIQDILVGVFAKKGSPERPEFSMRQAVREGGGTVIFIEYDLSVGETLGPIYRILLDQALKEALGRKEYKNRNVYMVIDEFKLAPKMTHIDDGCNFGRSLGIRIFAGLQSISQLEDIYGEARAKVIASGFMNLFSFHVWDKPSREYIMEHFGKTYETYSFVNSYDKSIDSHREGSVIADWDILSLGKGEAYVSLIGHEPFRFQFEKYK